MKVGEEGGVKSHPGIGITKFWRPFWRWCHSTQLVPKLRLCALLRAGATVLSLATRM